MTTSQASSDLAQRLGATAHVATVVDVQALSPSLHEVTLQAPLEVAGAAGNDVMFRLSDATGHVVNRRYSVRSVDSAMNTISFWIHTAHEGIGADWVRSAQVGQEIEIVGPRGKITLDEMADWHLFIGDASSLGSFYRLAEEIEVPGRAIFIVEVEAGDDAITATFDEGLGVTGIFIDRQGRHANDPAGVLAGLAAFALPSDLGHAYLFGEFQINRAAKAALLDRGMAADQISLKAFWRQGRSNQEHGEPEKN